MNAFKASKLLSSKKIGIGAAGLGLGALTALLSEGTTDAHSKSKGVLSKGKLLEYGVAAASKFLGGTPLAVGSAVGSKLVGGLINKASDDDLRSNWRRGASEWRDAAYARGGDLRDRADEWREQATGRARGWRDEASRRGGRAYDALMGRDEVRTPDSGLTTILTIGALAAVGVGAAIVLSDRQRRQRLASAAGGAVETVRQTASDAVEATQEAVHSDPE